MPRRILKAIVVLGACAWLVPAPQAAAQALDLDKLFADAEVAFKSQDFGAAAAKLEALLKEAQAGDPNAPVFEMVRYNLGRAYLNGEQEEKAIKAFQECLAAFPKGAYTSRCRLDLGRAYMVTNKDEEAVRELTTAALDPRLRTESAFILAKVYTNMGKKPDALKVLSGLLKVDVRTPDQTSSAVEAAALLGELGEPEMLGAYLARLNGEIGVRKAFAWVTSQYIVKAEELGRLDSKDDDAAKARKHASALAFYRAVPPRAWILATQRPLLEDARKTLADWEARLKTDRERKPAPPPPAGGAAPAPAGGAAPAAEETAADEMPDSLVRGRAFIEAVANALTNIESTPDMDATLVTRRGISLARIECNSQALLCFREVRTKYPQAVEAERAAFAELVVLYRLNQTKDLEPLAREFLAKYPNSENAEQASRLVGKALIDKGDQKAIADFFGELYTKFPKSETREDYLFTQAQATFMQAEFKAARDLYEKLLKDYPASLRTEEVRYRVALSYFLSNDYKNSLASLNDYLQKYPNGDYAADATYRLAFIKYQDTEQDNSLEIIRDLEARIAKNAADPAAGAMLCLLGDVYQKKEDIPRALQAYRRAVFSNSAGDVRQYGLDTATELLREAKDWKGIADLHGEVLKERPDDPLAILSANWVAKARSREGRNEEAAKTLADTLAKWIESPANEQVEPLIDEIVKLQLPKRRGQTLDPAAVEKTVEKILQDAIGDKGNDTTKARMFYARARTQEALRRPNEARGILASMASSVSPEAMSPLLLSAAGEVLLQDGKIPEAAAMFRRLTEKYPDSVFSDAGPVGLGQIALAQKKPQEALNWFVEALERSRGSSRYKEAMLGRLQALTAVGQLDEAEKMGLEMIGVKEFKGETVGKAYLLLADVMMAKARGLSGEAALEYQAKAKAYCDRVYLTYKGFPSVAAQGYLKVGDILKEMGKWDEATKAWNDLINDPKLKDTPEAQEARTRSAQ